MSASRSRRPRRNGTIMNEIVPVDGKKAPLVAGRRPAAIVPRTFEEVWRIAKLVAGSGLAPKDMDTPEKCAIAIMHGAEVGMPPMQSLQRICVINGRPTIWGDGALALVQRSGLMELIEEKIVDDTCASCIVKRRGEEPIERTFSVAQAKLAGLWDKRNTPWVTYPKRMLQMRARGLALRDAFADVLGGLYITEELDAGPMKDITPPDPPASKETPRDLIQLADPGLPAGDGRVAEASAPSAPSDPEGQKPAKAGFADATAPPSDGSWENEIEETAAGTTLPSPQPVAATGSRPAAAAPVGSFPELPDELDRRPGRAVSEEDQEWLRNFGGGLNGAGDLS